MIEHYRNVTQGDVAKYAGVSRSVVSSVIHNSGRPVAEETRVKVLEAIKKLGYRPNLDLFNNTGSDRQLGVIIADVYMLRRPFYADILAGIHSKTHEHGYHINYIRFFNDLKDKHLFEELINNKRVSGIILISLDQKIKSKEDSRLIIELKNRVNNLICVEWSFDGISSINFSRQEAAYIASSYILNSNRVGIHYIGPTDERVMGYHRALIEIDKMDYLNSVTYGFTSEDGYTICQRIINSGNIPQNFVGGTDEVSIGILNCLYENDIKVPEDVAVISIDNIEMASFTNPPLTTVNVETWEMGTYAVNRLIESVESNNKLTTITLLPTSLVVRKSC